MTTEIMKPENAALERVLIAGDLASLNADQRVQYYNAVCRSLGLNGLTRPFDYLELDDGKGNKRLVLYANKGAAEQLRALKDVSIEVVDRAVEDDVAIVRVRAKMPGGRVDEAIGAVPLYKEDGTWKKTGGGKSFFEPNGKRKPLGAVERANAVMKAETKAKRRVTLSICGPGSSTKPTCRSWSRTSRPPVLGLHSRPVWAPCLAWSRTRI
jgi:hypothetical protein